MRRSLSGGETDRRGRPSHTTAASIGRTDHARREPPSRSRTPFATIERKRRVRPLQPQRVEAGARRGLHPDQQAEEAARRGRQRRERLRADAQLAERAREPGRGLRGARHAHAGGRRRGGQAEQRQRYQPPRTCLVAALAKFPPPRRARAPPTPRLGRAAQTAYHSAQRSAALATLRRLRAARTGGRAVSRWPPTYT